MSKRKHCGREVAYIAGKGYEYCTAEYPCEKCRTDQRHSPDLPPHYFVDGCGDIIEETEHGRQEISPEVAAEMLTARASLDPERVREVVKAAGPFEQARGNDFAQMLRQGCAEAGDLTQVVITVTAAEYRRLCAALARLEEKS